MKIAILDLTQHPLPLLSGICRAGECIKGWIRPGFLDTKFEVFNVVGSVDQVTRSPDCATVVASADYCPFASLEYTFPAFSVQYHPEFEKEYFEKLLLASDGIFLS